MLGEWRTTVDYDRKKYKRETRFYLTFHSFLLDQQQRIQFRYLLRTSTRYYHTMENNRFLVLISSTFATPKQTSEQSRAVSMLQSLRFAFDVVDGSDIANKEM